MVEDTCTGFLVQKIWIDGEQGYDDDDGRLGGLLNVFYWNPCCECECM